MKPIENNPDSFECVRCGATIPISAQVCPSCSLILYPSDTEENSAGIPDLDDIARDEQPEILPDRLEASFIVKWILSIGPGTAIGIFLLIIIYEALFPTGITESFVTGPFAFIFYISLISLIQWLFLRKRIQNTKAWVPFTILGALLSILLFALLAYFGISLGRWSSIFFGAIIGGFQHQVLGRRFQHSEWWIISSTVGWFLSQEMVYIDNLAIELLALLVYPAITGFTLAWLVKYPLSRQ